MEVLCVPGTQLEVSVACVPYEQAFASVKAAEKAALETAREETAREEAQLELMRQAKAHAKWTLQVPELPETDVHPIYDPETPGPMREFAKALERQTAPFRAALPEVTAAGGAPRLAEARRQP